MYPVTQQHPKTVTGSGPVVVLAESDDTLVVDSDSGTVIMVDQRMKLIFGTDQRFRADRILKKPK